MTVELPSHVERVRRGRANGGIFAELLDSKELPKLEKTVYCLAGEGFSLLSAGTETTAVGGPSRTSSSSLWATIIYTTLPIITCYLLAQSEKLVRLKVELSGADPKNLKWSTLEQPSYLYGIIHEAVYPREPRIARDEVLTYQKGKSNYGIPKGIPVGMSSVIQHREEIFPGSYTYKPERWINPISGQKYQALEKYPMSFSKGRWAVPQNDKYKENPSQNPV
ncbi:uncharacterized protein PG986_003023 [Apiospora aurea]|uniref:Uncharacterized protein n=1 Tax=Apiospora aurea TaxID=335848 RepID=A0ABR1QQG6_9PEZI